jgi:small-conductance mechanosensitive channel
MLAKLQTFLADPWIRGGVIILGAVFAALLFYLIISRWLLHLTGKTKTDVDDRIVVALRRPIFVSVLLLGLYWAAEGLQLKPMTSFVLHGVLKTLAVIVWATSFMRIGSLILQAISRHSDKLALVQPRTLPLFDILVKVMVVGGAIYFAFLSWDINVTGWLASAGIVGIAVGFAAKDTLANLFAGIFILADAPYKLGDFVILDSGLRGRITDIGIRSTRILTRDDIEITVPNAVIANSKIVNETGGPHEKERVRITVSVAYGSDVDQVREVLLSCAKEVDHLCTEPAPRVRFREFGDSGLVFQLLAWIDEPVLRGRLTDELNTRVYKALNEAGIEIPYPKHDVYIKETPGGSLS